MQEVVDILTQFISNCGFPIVACILMFKQNADMRKSLDENTEAIRSVKEYIGELHGSHE